MVQTVRHYLCRFLRLYLLWPYFAVREYEGIVLSTKSQNKPIGESVLFFLILSGIGMVLGFAVELTLTTMVGVGIFNLAGTIWYWFYTVKSMKDVRWATSIWFIWLHLIPASFIITMYVKVIFEAVTKVTHF